jgi:hypothetical protein
MLIKDPMAEIYWMRFNHYIGDYYQLGRPA